MEQPIWGIDLGGTKVEGVVLRSTSDPTVLSRLRLPTEREKGYDHIIGQIKRLLELLEEECKEPPQRIGIGTPGVSDPFTGLMKNSNTTVLNGMPFRSDLQSSLGIDVSMTNDANCFALAETQMGVVKEECPEAKVIFGVIMGTGVGGGIVFNGNVWNGHMGIGGEWGHNFLDHSGGDCYCGKMGCVEKIISGPALSGYYESISGKKASMKEIIELSDSGDQAARQTMDRLFHFFGLAISQVINILDPDAIVIGGGLGNIEALYTEGVRQINDFLFNDRLQTRILKPKLGDSAGVFGAAFLNVSNTSNY